MRPFPLPSCRRRGRPLRAAAAAKAGDLIYYAPWGNLAIFYRDGGAAPDTGLIVLGQIADGGTERLATAEKITMEAAS
ncbi:cyclophilin-like fold protein [Streptomyces sp. NPDC049597]|uniref:cyclophilin-like fold protein n=1 Tax=Streptomyces sp. NPDC049597 TaxID=3155276 RepID=UPI003442002C